MESATDYRDLCYSLQAFRRVSCEIEKYEREKEGKMLIIDNRYNLMTNKKGKFRAAVMCHILVKHSRRSIGMSQLRSRARGELVIWREWVPSGSRKLRSLSSVRS